MRSTGLRRPLARAGVAALSALALLALSPVGADAAPAPDAARGALRLYVPPPDKGAVTQLQGLLRAHDFADANLLRKMVQTPQAVWFTSGTPAQVRREVRKTMDGAQDQHAVPILVAYNLPFRDCSQYSAGGAADTTADRPRRPILFTSDVIGGG